MAMYGLLFRCFCLQGAPVTALKLWAAWQTRHSAMDVGTMAVCWLLVACAEVGDWAAGQQLLRFLDQELFTVCDAHTHILHTHTHIETHCMYAYNMLQSDLLCLHAFAGQLCQRAD